MHALFPGLGFYLHKATPVFSGLHIATMFKARHCVLLAILRGTVPAMMTLAMFPETHGEKGLRGSVTGLRSSRARRRVGSGVSTTMIK